MLGTPGETTRRRTRRWLGTAAALAAAALLAYVLKNMSGWTGRPEFRGPPAEPPVTVSAARRGACATIRARVGDGREFHYVRTIAAPLTGLQASYYDPVEDVVVLLSHHGEGARIRRDGSLLGRVGAPVEVASSLDGAAFDRRRGVALLVDQACVAAEVDPGTLARRGVGRLGGNSRHALHCGAVALAGDDGLQVADTVRRERVLLSSDGHTQLRRISVAPGGVDGLAWISATDEWLAVDDLGGAAILDVADRVIVPRGRIGEAPPLLGGDPLTAPDATHVVCRTGEVWVCEGAGARCNVYAPPGPPVDACACL